MRTLKGKATILFDKDEGLKIELEDRGSGTTIRASLDSYNTIAALSRQACVDCEIIYPNDLSLVGKKREVQRVLIDRVLRWDYKPTAEQVMQRCEDEGILVDGWEIWDDGRSTQQNISGKHEVILDRYVEALGGESEQIPNKA